MVVVTPSLIQDKKVLLRLDLDVSIENGAIVDDCRLQAALPTLAMCLDYALSTVIMGHIGRPQGEDPQLSVKPIYDWLIDVLDCDELEDCHLKLLENLRFDSRELAEDANFAKEIAALGDFFINEAFAAYHPAVSTTVLPTLLPSALGLRFAEEIRVLGEVRDPPAGGPKRPLVVIIGGAKVEDKLPLISQVSKLADTVLVGGKLIKDIIGNYDVVTFLGSNVLVGELNAEGYDITPATVEKWTPIIKQAKMIVWNGPLGQVENPVNDQTKQIAQLVMASRAESIVGGGDTIGYLGKTGLLGSFSFVSTGGGAMLKFLETGTLPTIEALK